MLWLALASALCASTPAHAGEAALIFADQLHAPASAPAASEAPAATDTPGGIALQLSTRLFDESIAPVAASPTPRPAPHTAPPPASISASGLWRFAYWFALLLLLCIAARDTLRLMLQILWQPAPRQAPLPFAQWPGICLSFEARSPEMLEQTLWRIQELDYPAERIHLIALCDLQSEAMQTALQAAQSRPGCRLEAVAARTQGDAASRCFAAALQSRQGDIVMAIPAGEPLDRQALRRCAEAFLDPTLGALLGYLPLGAPGDQGIAARLSRLLRRASQHLSLTPAQSLPPGTGLVALRRACALASDIDTGLPRGTLAILLDVETAAWRISLQASQTAAGEPMQDWDSRARWLRRRAQARIENNAALKLFGLLHQGRFAGEPGPVLTLLWIALFAAALQHFVMGEVFAAGMGLAVCMACAFSAEARPASLLGMTLLLRSSGRHTSTTLATLAPVVFIHDLQVTLRQTLRSLARRLRPATPAALQPDAQGAPTTH